MEAYSNMPSPANGKKLSSFDVFCLGVNAIIGSGIFLFPGLLAREAGPSSIAAFLVCGMLLTFVALCYAELGSIYKRNGGSYVYAREAFGPRVGFAVGWMSWVTAIFSWAAVANAVSSYAGYFSPVFNTLVAGKCISCSLVLVLGMVNYRGIKLGAWAVNIFTIGKLAPLVLFVAVGFFFISGEHFHPFWGTGTGTFGHAVFLALWSLQGFEIASLPAGETDHPQRAVPVAAVGSLICATVMYVLVQAVAVGVFAGLAASTGKPLADAAAVFMGPAGGLIIALGSAGFHDRLQRGKRPRQPAVSVFPGRRPVFTVAPFRSAPLLSYTGRGNYSDHRPHLLRGTVSQLPAARHTQQSCGHLPVSLNLLRGHSPAAHQAAA